MASGIQYGPGMSPPIRPLMTNARPMQKPMPAPVTRPPVVGPKPVDSAAVDLAPTTPSFSSTAAPPPVGGVTATVEPQTTLRPRSDFGTQPVPGAPLVRPPRNLQPYDPNRRLRWRDPGNR